MKNSKFVRGTLYALLAVFLVALPGKAQISQSPGSFDSRAAWFQRWTWTDPEPLAPEMEKPSAGNLSGVVIDESGIPVRQATVEIEGGDQRCLSGPDGFFSFPELQPGQISLRVQRSQGAEAQTITPIFIAAGEVVLVVCSPQTGAEKAPMLRVIAPNPRDRSSRDIFNVAGQTDPGNKATINGQEAHVFKTGIFVADGLPLTMGMNRFEIMIESPSGFLLPSGFLRLMK